MTDAPTEGSEQDGQQILVVALDKPGRASELLLTLSNLATEGKVQMHDAVIVSKDDEGRSHTVQTVDVTPARGALAGAWWGMLGGLLIAGPAFLAGAVGGAAAGALYGKLVDRGLDDAWIKDMAGWVEPGRSALLLLVDAGFDDAVLTELRRFEGIGHVAYTTLPPDTKAEIEQALAGAGHPLDATDTPG
ncbi:MAG: DUF1269 domain-containing protein [Acidimicrobiales bacterium]|nr:DUF1269 domain-containing protein [Acidimicrobiales bacterium]